MAKGTGIFLSLKVRGQVFKTLVATSWKGLNVLRSYVIPANPNTAAQQAVRAVTTAVNQLWHAINWSPDDFTAWNLLASIRANPESGFNSFFRQAFRVLRLLIAWSDLWDGKSTIQPGTDVRIYCKGDPGLPSVKFLWGYTRLALVNGNTNSGTFPGGWYLDIATGTIPSGATIFWTCYDGASLPVGNGRIGIYKWTQP